MKTVITPSYTFTPSSQILDLSSYSGFSIKCLYAVINQTRDTIIYATGTTGYGYSAYSSGVLTLQASTTGMSSTDDLMIIYDVSNADGGSLAHITNFPSTQAISGNISVVSGTISATQSGTWNIGNISTLPSLPTGTNTIGSIKLTDGSNTPAVKAASTAPVATDPALVVTLSPNSVTVPISGNVSVTGVATDTHLTNVQSAPGTTQTTAVTIQGNTSGIAVPISGNVSVVSGTISATQSGTWNIGNISTLPSLPTGTNTIGKVGIDQTTPGTTNGVVVNSSALPTGAAADGIDSSIATMPTGGVGIRGWLSGIYAAIDGTLTVSWTGQSVTIATVSLPSTSTSSAASSLVLKSAPGSLVTLDVVAGAVAGYIMLFDATGSPADGAVSPKWVFAMAAGGALTEDWPNPLSFATGIVAVFSSTGPFIKTESATAFMAGQVQ